MSRDLYTHFWLANIFPFLTQSTLKEYNTINKKLTTAELHDRIGEFNLHVKASQQMTLVSRKTMSSPQMQWGPCIVYVIISYISHRIFRWCWQDKHALYHHATICMTSQATSLIYYLVIGGLDNPNISKAAYFPSTFFNKTN